MVATIERPASHHGTLRPEAKNSDVLARDRLARNSAGTKQTRILRAAITQSIQEIFTKDAVGVGEDGATGCKASRGAELPALASGRKLVEDVAGKCVYHPP